MAAAAHARAALALCRPGSTSGTVPYAKLAGIAPALLVRTAPGAAREGEAAYTAAPPTRDASGAFVFKGQPLMRPNLSPAEVLALGSFGGSYFRPIASGVTGKVHADAWRELPADWLASLDVKKLVAAEAYDAGVNRYGVSCGLDLREWESSAWIVEQDPFGWFQW